MYSLAKNETGAGNTAVGAEALSENVSGFSNTAVGNEALLSNRTGSQSSAFGAGALRFPWGSSDNTAVGYSALSGSYERPRVGSRNSALGVSALSDNTGSDNTGVGAFALADSQGDRNTAAGVEALSWSLRGNDNTAVGFRALKGLEEKWNGDEVIGTSTGSANAALGAYALGKFTSGQHNAAVGAWALGSTTVGENNVAVGFAALFRNVGGCLNTGQGFYALNSNTSGNWNTASGAYALDGCTTGSRNVGFGAYSLHNVTTGSENIALGHEAGVNIFRGSRNICLGSLGDSQDNDTIRIGNPGRQSRVFIAGISGVTSAAGAPVYVNMFGQLGTLTSSSRFKEAIKDMDATSSALLKLKPVTFHYKKEIDSEAVPQYGLIAEEVEKVDPNLVLRDADGVTYTVRYEAVNAMLLNEFLKQHTEVQEQRKTIAGQQAGIRALAARLEQVDLRMQKMSARLEESVPFRAVADRR
jgi:hypothetical protein